MNWRVRILRAVIPAAAAVLACADTGRAQPLQEPFLSGRQIKVQTYGDAANVRLLAQLLQDPDPLVREQALVGLGQTHNPDALPHLRQALKDPDPGVRAAAASAAIELSVTRSGELVIAALDSDEQPVVLAALRRVRTMRLASARPKVVKLLASDDYLVQAVSLHTLTTLGMPAPEERLAGLLQSRLPILRLRAAENSLLSKDGRPLSDALAQLAGDLAPAVRGAALAAMGKHDFDRAKPLLAKARNDPAVLVRRGLVLAYAHAGRADKIRPFLDDPSAPVRLAAIDSAGQLKCADCVQRLFEIMLAARDDLSHDRAREALAKIATADIADRAAAALNQIYSQLLREPKRPRNSPAPPMTPEAKQRVRLLERSAASCCRLLGQLKSAAGMDTLLALTKSETLDSPVLAAAAEAMGNIGDARAIAALTARMPECMRLAKEYLAQRQASVPKYVPFGEDVAGEIVAALGSLAATEAVVPMLQLALTGVAGQRLSWAAACPVRTVVTLADATNRDRIDRAILKILSDPAYDVTVRFVAAKAAGKLTLAAATPALEKILNRDRPCRQVMHAAAWAIQQITGATPAIPAPRVKQGRWIITKSGS